MSLSDSSTAELFCRWSAKQWAYERDETMRAVQDRAAARRLQPVVSSSRRPAESLQGLLASVVRRQPRRAHPRHGTQKEGTRRSEPKAHSRLPPRPSLRRLRRNRRARSGVRPPRPFNEARWHLGPRAALFLADRGSRDRAVRRPMRELPSASHRAAARVVAGRLAGCRVTGLSRGASGATGAGAQSAAAPTRSPCRSGRRRGPGRRRSPPAP